jgi:hypothetical protein
VAAADLNGDGPAEIVTGPGAGGGPQVRVFNRWGEAKTQFFAYAENFRKGLDVTAKPANSNSPGLIITGAGPGGTAHVRVFNMWGDLRNQFFAFDSAFRGGVNVDVDNIYDDTDEYEIAVVPASHGGPQIRLYSETGQLLSNLHSFEPWWRGGYDIAAGTGVLTISSQQGNRRASVRSVIE